VREVTSVGAGVTRSAGVPVGFLLFSAPVGNRNTSAGYDSTILQTLLECWKDAVEADGQGPLDIRVVMTDTDLKERLALSQIWPSARLMLCLRHLRQSWKNKRKEVGGPARLIFVADFLRFCRGNRRRFGPGSKSVFTGSSRSKLRVRV
jgi:hypothetical protein